MKMELRKTFQFEAAHLLPHLPKSHKCRRLHGHSFKAEIVVAGECDTKLGWLMDYADITAAFKSIWEKLDHRYLNEIPGLENPTSEEIAVWIWKKHETKAAVARGSGCGRDLHGAGGLSRRVNFIFGGTSLARVPDLQIRNGDSLTSSLRNVIAAGDYAFDFA